jgi:hypothetical protein
MVHPPCIATGGNVPILIEHRQRSSHALLVLSGVAALLDTVIGVIINLALDHSRPYDNLLGISLVLGLPMYWLDVRLKKRFVFFLAFLFCIPFGDSQSAHSRYRQPNR